MRDVIIGGRYRHYKGNEYRALAVGRHTETLEECVVYQALYGANEIWIRPKAMFLETVEAGGKAIPRFELVSAT